MRAITTPRLTDHMPRATAASDASIDLVPLAQLESRMSTDAMLADASTRAGLRVIHRVPAREAQTSAEAQQRQDCAKLDRTCRPPEPMRPMSIAIDPPSD